MSDSRQLLDLIEKLGETRVVCVGDIMLDRFVYGDVSRISPEAPVPVCRVVSENAMVGGAGNVARNLAVLGASVDFISVVGADKAADEIRSLVGNYDQISAEFITDSERQTTIKERFVAGPQQLLRVDREETEDVGPEICDQLIKHVCAALPGAGALILSDYDKGVLSAGSIIELIGAANDAGCPVIIDPKGVDYRRYSGATLITPNRRELCEASRKDIFDDDSAAAAAKFIASEYGIGNVLVTRSAEGMTLVSRAGVDHLSAEAREVFDVSGAGDTVVATLAAALAAGSSLIDAAQLANVAAGIVVGKTGTAVADGSEIAGSLRRQDLQISGELKVMPLTAAAEQVAAWRQQGERVGFTNGCFDLIHPGHVAILAKSRAACDRLVVGLNADESVKRLKGETRPVQNEASRAAVMASLASVDLVVLFEEDTPVNLIEALRPDVLAKGADYTVDEVVGAEFVQSYGGEILLVDLEEGHSTTGTIERMAP
ncbi:MAG: D-glycero-beta-D-manno-heptose-7-phosphate kinase [Alphaproteobacteria bacterium]|nr:D-glycero-beta-D-manno-heptose-7-phosphate kinase [Alphaproteobacteria bacterium]